MNRCGYDRRFENDRRKVYSVNYYENGGTERRKRQDRRVSEEMRGGWLRISKFSSVAIGDSPSELKLRL